MEQYGLAPLLVPLVATLVLAVAVAAIFWARSTMNAARRRARSSATGSAGTPPLTTIPGSTSPQMWTPTDARLRDWRWSGGRAQPPDVLSGPHAVYDTVVAREIRGEFDGREAFAQVRTLQSAPIVAQSAPPPTHTHWSKICGVRSRVTLPRFFLLTGQTPLLTGIRPLEAAAGLTKVADTAGRGTILWAEPSQTEALLTALRTALPRETPTAYLFASEGELLYVCESSGEDEEAVVARLERGTRVLRAWEDTTTRGTPH